MGSARDLIGRSTKSLQSCPNKLLALSAVPSASAAPPAAVFGTCKVQYYPCSCSSTKVSWQRCFPSHDLVSFDCCLRSCAGMVDHCSGCPAQVRFQCVLRFLLCHGLGVKKKKGRACPMVGAEIICSVGCLVGFCS